MKIAFSRVSPPIDTHYTNVLMDTHLPFTVGKHELPQFEIAQHDALLVARLDHLAHLAEQPTGFRLAQALPDANVRMEIAL